MQVMREVGWSRIVCTTYSWTDGDVKSRRDPEREAVSTDMTSGLYVTE